ncbi:hypothetical protein EVAR_17337_1 [Eumeta japonica]|uniref:Uncharacterized protein n=1 Tax=Eumeta variegata TaxID=151549 RepID=A0A4C1TT75_EUMVA|nr:hypothetical protein EVAR_17337_1 [Eumeta japonica]
MTWRVSESTSFDAVAALWAGAVPFSSELTLKRHHDMPERLIQPPKMSKLPTANAGVDLLLHAYDFAQSV